MANLEGIGHGVGLEYAVGEEGFVVLHAQMGQKSRARHQEQQARGQRVIAEIENTNEANH